MSALKLHQETVPFRSKLPEWVAPVSRVFLGLCLLASGLVVWSGAHDLLLAMSAGRSFVETRREDEALRMETNKRLTALIIKLDRLEKARGTP